MVESFLAAFGLTPSDMPAVNAALNGLAAVLLLAGYSFIRARRVTPHKWSMIAAFTVSVIFLASYLYFHLVVKRGEPTRFTAIGWPRYLYFTILTTHTILAAAVAVLVPITLVLGFGAPGNRHRRLARWTFPIWLYVSVTGVVVYLMLYQVFPPAGP